FSVTTYSADSWIVEKNFALNDRAAEANDDGSITFRYNCPGKPNNIDVQPGWTQVIRLYLPESAEAVSAYVADITGTVKIEPGA
ncbi:MAG: lytic murein transglycosylase, partial [Gemmatimonadota bacterium]